MGDRNITLFALHTHGDTQFGPSSVPGVGEDEESMPDAASKAKSWFKSGDDEEQATEEEHDIDVSESEESSGGLAGIVVALVVLVGIAMLAKRLTGGEETEVEVAESDDL